VDQHLWHIASKSTVQIVFLFISVEFDIIWYVNTVLRKFRLFWENSLLTISNLDEIRKNIFVDFLCEFEDVFSEDIVAGNCDVVEHVINVKDSSPIKQVPRRIPIHLQKKIFKNIEEMKERGVIEESQSPLISLAVLKEKKMEH